MAKAKSKATILAGDGAGGLAPVEDRRFEQGDWPIRFEVAKEQADTWLQYLSADCRRRGWSCASLGQLEARENSGSITVNTGGDEQLQLAVVWERKRGGPLRIRARPAGAPEFPLPKARELFQQVGESCQLGARERFYFPGQLEIQWPALARRVVAERYTPLGSAVSAVRDGSNRPASHLG